MDYILSKINSEITELEFLKKDSLDLKENCRVRAEYPFVLMLAYLWNKNLAESPRRQDIEKAILKPSLGTILWIIEQLDQSNEVLSLQTKNILKEYNSFRIDTTGHGIVYSDYLPEYIEELNNIFKNISESNTSLICSDLSFVLPLLIEGNSVKGKIYRSDGTTAQWTSDMQGFNFKKDTLVGYQIKQGALLPQYFTLSPFVHIENDNEIYLFKCVEQKLTGAIRYNRIFKTNTSFVKEWKEFSEVYQAKSSKVSISPNNTIVNRFSPNYNQHNYIDLGENKKKVYDFLTGVFSKGSVCANLWGHGGVGKTATIQNIIEELKTSSQKEFNYIIFLSNKDRFYNIFRDKIEKIGSENRVESFQDLIKGINVVINDSDFEDIDEDQIINFDYGKILIVVDDFETFSREDQLLINDFIKKLNPQHHKVIITTRSTIRVGTDDINFNELDENETVRFFLNYLKSKYLHANKIAEIEKELSQEEIKRKLRLVTLGRPLRILQFEYVYNAIGNLEKTIAHFLNAATPELSEFFYGRFYLYLTQDARDVYSIMGQLTYDEDLISTLSKVRFALVWGENNESRFVGAVGELEKLRIIEKLDEERFKVWDKDILKGMKSSFSEKKDSKDFNKGNVLKRLKQISGKDDLYESLLKAARQNKVLEKSESEIKSGFKQILNREDSPLETKYQALFELANYYRINLGNSYLAYQEFQNYESMFDGYFPFIKTYSLVCYENELVNKSVELLEEVLKNKEKKNKLNEEGNLDFTGLLITRKKRLLLDEANKHGIRNIIRVHDSSSTTQKELNSRITSLIENIGKDFFSRFRKHTFIDKGKKTNGATGLRHLADLAVMMRENSLAEAICSYCIDNLDDHWKNQFKTIQNQIKTFVYFSKPKPSPVSSNLNESSITVLNNLKVQLESDNNKIYTGKIVSVVKSVTGTSILIKSSDLLKHVYYKAKENDFYLKKDDEVKFKLKIFKGNTPYKFRKNNGTEAFVTDELLKQ